MAGESMTPHFVSLLLLLLLLLLLVRLQAGTNFRIRLRFLEVFWRGRCLVSTWRSGLKVQNCKKIKNK